MILDVLCRHQPWCWCSKFPPHGLRCSCCKWCLVTSSSDIRFLLQMVLDGGCSGGYQKADQVSPIKEVCLLCRFGPGGSTGHHTRQLLAFIRHSLPHIARPIIADSGGSQQSCKLRSQGWEIGHCLTVQGIMSAYRQDVCIQPSMRNTAWGLEITCINSKLASTARIAAAETLTRPQHDHPGFEEQFHECRHNLTVITKVDQHSLHAHSNLFGAATGTHPALILVRSLWSR